MKKLLLTLIFLFSLALLYGQSKVDSLVQIGINYHDNRDFDKAIEIYKKALEIEPESAIANYELAFTYMEMEDYENAIKYSDIVIQQKGDYILAAYNIKGSSLDYLGKTEESIELFEQAIEEFGDHYLLYYNVGVNYYRLEKYDEAEFAFFSALADNFNHAGSHFLLAQLKNDQNERIKSLLGLYFFLLIEPNTQRSEIAYELLTQQLGGNVRVDEDNPNNITIFIDSEHLDSEFSSAETMISLLGASNFLEENKDKTAEELFIHNTESLFNVLGIIFKEKEDEERQENLWNVAYIPFFSELKQAGFIETLCYYISMSSNDKAVEWLESNNEKVEDFINWLNSDKDNND